MSNVAKSALGLFVYIPLVGINITAEILARTTENLCRWFERDEAFKPNDGVDGDSTPNDQDGDSLPDYPRSFDGRYLRREDYIG